MSLCQYIFWVKEESFEEMKIMCKFHVIWRPTVTPTEGRRSLTSFEISLISSQARVDEERTLARKEAKE
jgi:hypothetical protein